MADLRSLSRRSLLEQLDFSRCRMIAPLQVRRQRGFSALKRRPTQCLSGSRGLLGW
ncbi:hypothetical protein AXF42_Ash001085 [Apostasia shenzhenica]|uniref:Uncharacterized protein n=1 Tax=Apostasia shenzhenica TaxID=1088818 RepID=A0A2I0ATZ0_9ASPA|nr:hypothetical protein AXF42_Ash001085 [Apostasia shenzhenica]